MTAVGTPCDAARAASLRVTARLGGPVRMPGGRIALDALLAYWVFAHANVPDTVASGEVLDVEIPILREPDGRFHLCSWSVFEIEQHELTYTNQRFPDAEAQGLGTPKLRRINIKAGRTKSYRLPRDVLHLVDDCITWWCIGDAERIRELLASVTHVGGKRSVGLGRVLEWTVEECEPWEPGFPVVLDGRPLRALPPEWPGLGEDMRVERTALTMPYWLAERRQLCAVP